MKSVKRVCVFCGSNSGSDPLYTEAVKELGTEMIRRRQDLVYGGGNMGLMGVIANTIKRGGGKVTGVIPESIASRFDHSEVSELIVTSSMHERKAKMFELAGAFIALPGGFGTLEEILEIITWAQLGYHDKPMGFFNIGGFYDGLFKFLEGAVKQQFIKKSHLNMVVNQNSADKLLDKINLFQNPKLDKWHN